MGADKDIVERLLEVCTLPDGRQLPPRAGPWMTGGVDLIREAAAAIGRLRGEVEALRQCGVKYLGWLGVKDAEKALRKDMADPEMVERPAPAMPNGVESAISDADIAEWDALRGEGMTSAVGEYTPEEFWWVLGELKRYRAADNRDAAGVEARRHAANEWADMAINGVQWLRNIRDGVSTVDEALAEMESNMVRVRALNDAAQAAPAAVPAGEAVATEKNVHTEHCCREHGCKYGEAACPVELGQQVQSHPCEDCAPQPADGEAVASAWETVHILTSVMRYRPLTISEQDELHGAHITIRTTTPPAPVQAAPQEGEQVQGEADR